jgi:outer membrane protein W
MMTRTWLLLVIPVAVCLMMADLAVGSDIPPDQAWAPFKNMDIGFKVGYLNFRELEDFDNAFALGLNAGTEIIPNVKVEFNADYWTKSQEEQNGFSTKWKNSDLSLGGTLYYLPPINWKNCLFPAWGGVQPYIGWGFGAHLIKWEWEQKNHDSYKEDGSDTKFGYHGIGGFQMDVTPKWNVFTEFRYADAHDVDNYGGFLGARYQWKF